MLIDEIKNDENQHDDFALFDWYQSNGEWYCKSKNNLEFIRLSHLHFCTANLSPKVSTSSLRKLCEIPLSLLIILFYVHWNSSRVQVKVRVVLSDVLMSEKKMKFIFRLSLKWIGFPAPFLLSHNSTFKSSKTLSGVAFRVSNNLYYNLYTLYSFHYTSASSFFHSLHINPWEKSYIPKQ